jgi:Flp pilus assembly protein TadG
MNRLVRWSRGSQAGQTLVEFALAVPILAIMFFGICEFAIIQDNQLQLRNAARNAVRAGAIHFETAPSPIPDADRVTAATSAAQAAGETSMISCPLNTPTVTPHSSANPPTLAVTLTCPYTPVTPLGALVTMLGTTLHFSSTLTSTTTRYIEP